MTDGSLPDRPRAPQPWREQSDSYDAMIEEENARDAQLADIRRSNPYNRSAPMLLGEAFGYRHDYTARVCEMLGQSRRERDRREQHLEFSPQERNIESSDEILQHLMDHAQASAGYSVHRFHVITGGNHGHGQLLEVEVSIGGVREGRLRYSVQVTYPDGRRVRGEAKPTLAEALYVVEPPAKR
jgi:hypothetical protein